MKQLIGVLTVAVALLAIPASHSLVGTAHASFKGHVPLKKAQTCHKGVVIVVSENAVSGHQRHGDCQLPACDFNNVFFAGDSCSSDDSGDGTCVLPNPRDSASGQTPGCPEGKF